jgi:homoserine kinase
MAKRTRHRPRASALHLELPATSANLGPAFDAAAVALDLYITVDAKPATEFSIAATGRDREICGRIENHLILTTYREILQGNRTEIIPLHLTIKNEIPIGKGCGSSAAARLAGIALANHFGKLGWSDAQIVGEASRREHHADNASACWLGGLTVARMANGGEVQVAQIRLKGKWPLLLAVPDQALSTEEARCALPARYSRTDAVGNIQNSLLLLAALTEGRHDWLRAGVEDRIHEPYRAALCPLLPGLRELRGKLGILGTVLSGAGPSVLVFLDPQVDAEKTRRMVRAHLARVGLEAELLLIHISQSGGKS